MKKTVNQPPTIKDVMEEIIEQSKSPKVREVFISKKVTEISSEKLPNYILEELDEKHKEK